MTTVEGFSSHLLAFLATYLVHSTLFSGAAVLLYHLVPPGACRKREWLLKGALFAGFVTTALACFGLSLGKFQLETAVQAATPLTLTANDPSVWLTIAKTGIIQQPDHIWPAATTLCLIWLAGVACYGWRWRQMHRGLTRFLALREKLPGQTCHHLLKSIAQDA